MLFKTNISFFPRNKHNIDHATRHIIDILSQSRMIFISSSNGITIGQVYVGCENGKSFLYRLHRCMNMDYTFFL